jgi:hypothetical protein
MVEVALWALADLVTVNENAATSPQMIINLLSIAALSV